MSFNLHRIIPVNIGNFQSSAILQYKEDEEDENLSEPESNAYQDDLHMHHIPSHKDVAYSHPTFPGKGQLILGQEQEILCGGFDDTDSLSADIFGFEVFSINLLNMSMLQIIYVCVDI